MRNWLERNHPPGDDITLPEGSGSFTFGRSPKCTVIFDDAVVSLKHCELTWDAGFWRLRDLGSEAGTRVNGFEINHGQALFPDDRIEFGNVQLHFRSDIAKSDPPSLGAIVGAPDEEAHWLVYADELQERGDPLGERIVRSKAGGGVDHLPWLGPLWDAFVAGELEIEWQFGFIKRATLRTVAGRMPVDWRALVAQLLNLRIGRFIRSLTIDLPKLENAVSEPPSAQVATAQQFFLNLPALPETIEHLSFGYQVAQTPSSIRASAALVLRLPRLASSIYAETTSVGLKVIHVTPSATLHGFEYDSRALRQVTRIRRGERGQLILESPPGIPLISEGNPCYFALAEGRVQLIAGRMRGEIRVNNRIDAQYELLLGDEIDVLGAARFRFDSFA